MAQYAKLEIIRQDLAGNPISGATISIYRQGATVQGAGPTSFTVDEPGGILAADTVIGVSADGLTERASATVSSIAVTNVTTGTGISSMVNNDRLVPTNAPPSTFKDSQGNEASGAVTTDTNGYAAVWIENAPYDIKSVGGTSPLGTAATLYKFDVYPAGMERALSNCFMTGTQVVQRRNTLRALLAGDKFYSLLSAGAEKWYVGIAADGSAIVPTFHAAGKVTVDTGGLTVTAGGLTVTAGSVSLPAATLPTASLALNAVSAATVLSDPTDSVVAVTETVMVTQSLTGVTSNTGALCIGSFNFDCTGTSTDKGRVEIRLYVGASLRQKKEFGFDNIPAAGTETKRFTLDILHFENPMPTSATVFSVRHIKTNITGSFSSNHLGSSVSPGVLQVIELRR